MKPILCLALLVLAGCADAKHYDVFLIAGQSNGDGRGAAADLTGELSRYAEPQPDVPIAYSCSSLRGPVLASEGFQPLQPGWSVAPGRNKPKSLPSRTFGPEVSFGRALADALPERHVALIKYAEGGTSLKRDWNPAVRDRLYDAFLAFVAQSLKTLTDRDDTYTVRGMIWHQGESDAGLPEGEYQTLLTDFIAKVRAALGVPELPFGIGEVYDNGKRDRVRAGQQATASAVPGAYFVSAEGLKTFDDGTHFDAASQIELGRRLGAGMVGALTGGE